MGLALFIQTILVCITTGNIAKNAWFSYILFLVFLGGILILFIYITSVASNELFIKIKIMPAILITLFIVSLLAVFVLIDPMLLTSNLEETTEIITKRSDSITVIRLFNYPNNIITISVVVYLFLTLIVVVKITESHQGPLRSTN
jgi:NADH-ubiquinone oxidoreductase chain 6